MPVGDHDNLEHKKLKALPVSKLYVQSFFFKQWVVFNLIVNSSRVITFFKVHVKILGF